MAAFSINIGDDDAINNMMKEAATKAVKEALAAEQPIRPVIQQVTQKTVEKVIEGTAKELTELHKVQMAHEALGYIGGAAVILSLFGGFKWLMS